MERKFNLIEEDWIPVSNKGKVSLRRVFSDLSLKNLGGTPVQKISILKLLLAIAQSASTPNNEDDWKTMGADGLAKKSIEYLENKKELFWLYGEKPFLQMPSLEYVKNKNGEVLPVSEIGRNYLPDLPSENDTLLFQTQINRDVTDAEKALFVVSIMNYSPGGKRTVKNTLPLTPEYKGKSNSSKAAPSIGGYVGYLNSCLWGSNIIDTLWLNLFTQQDISSLPSMGRVKNVPPWEEMPKGEDDEIAKRLKSSFMATLCSLSRFVLLKDNGIIYMEGIQYPGHKQGWREPFISSNPKGQMMWLDTSKKPWRNLISLLGYSYGSSNAEFNCPQISMLYNRARNNSSQFGIWSGGLQVRGTAGDQSVKQTDDYIESCVLLDSKQVGEIWFTLLQKEMQEIEMLSKRLYGSMKGYFDELMSRNKDLLVKAQSEFWNLCERNFQSLVDDCEDKESVFILRKTFAAYIDQIYNKYCPNDTARQISSWAKHRPRLGDYLTKEKEETVV